MTIVGLWVEDLDISRAFYQKIFWWKELPASNEGIAFFQMNGILLSLYPREKLAEDAGVDSFGEWFKGFSLAYNARDKAEVDAIFHDMDKKGVVIVKEPQEVFWWGYSWYIADPDENLWEIAYNPFLKLDDSWNALEGE